MMAQCTQIATEINMIVMMAQKEEIEFPFINRIITM